jgi:hypothetical protein
MRASGQASRGSGVASSATKTGRKTMWYLKKLSLSFFVISLISVSVASAQCPKKLDPIKLNKLKAGQTFTENGYTFRVGNNSQNSTTFDHRRLWTELGTNGAVISVTFEKDVGGLPGTLDCQYQVTSSGNPITKFLLHGEK